MLKYDRCPRCSCNFEDCPCSLWQVEDWKKEQVRKREIQKEVKKQLQLIAKHLDKTK